MRGTKRENRRDKNEKKKFTRNATSSCINYYDRAETGETTTAAYSNNDFDLDRVRYASVGTLT